MARKKLLVIDDSETNLLLFEAMFEDDPRVEVILKNNGEEIIDFCLCNLPDLILLDLMMPEVSGFDVLNLLQSNPELKHIPIIITSALSGPDNIKRTIAMGANDYIVKPIDFKENPIRILNALGLN